MKIIFCLFLLLSTSSKSHLPESVSDNDLRVLLGQKLIVGFQGTTPENVEPHIIDAIKKKTIGGVILFAFNIENKQQVQALLQYFKTLNPDLFVSVDQEGGRVQRLKPAQGFTQFPSAKAMAALPEKEAGDLYDAMMKEIHGAGFNMDFGPVVDLDTATPCPVIGGMERSYSSDPVIVAQYATLFIEAAKKHGIVTSLKHFPDHGPAQGDSHKGFVDVTDRWQEKGLGPYKLLIEKHLAQSVMTSHLMNRNIDDAYPATLSAKTLQGLLRKQLGFQGVIVSDDLCMGALVRHYGLQTVFTQPLVAGCDMVIISRNPKAIQDDPEWSPRYLSPQFLADAMDFLVAAVKDGTISYPELLISKGRIDALKKA